MVVELLCGDFAPWYMEEPWMPVISIVVVMVVAAEALICVAVVHGVFPLPVVVAATTSIHPSVVVLFDDCPRNLLVDVDSDGKGDELISEVVIVIILLVVVANA